MAESEIAKLRAEIETEYQVSMMGLHGPAVVGKHAIITHRFANLAPLLITCLEKAGPEETSSIIEEFEAKYPLGTESASDEAGADEA